LLTHTFQGKRDLLQLRQRSRQIARALGYSARDQALISAAVFQLGCCTTGNHRRGSIRFQLGDGKLLAISSARRASPSPDAPAGDGVRLEWLLPRRETPLALADLVWAVNELDELTPLDLFEEMRQQNLDLLQALHDLQSCRSELGRLQRPDAA